MENQGYEEDQSRAAEEQSTLESRHCDQHLHADTIDVINDSVVARTTTHPEGHVYEDIAIGAGIDTCELSERISCPDESRNPPEVGGHGSIDFAKQTWINRPSSPIDRLLYQNSALSSSTRISTNHDSVITSSWTTSKTSEDDSEKVSSSPPTNEDSSRDTPMTSGDTPVQSNRRPNRRRRKKDCKHCRSKLADAGSCEKLDQLVGNKDAVLRENGDIQQDRHPDAPTLLFGESLLKPQNIKIYPLVSRTSLRDIGGKRSSSTAFPASEYGVHMMENPARLLLNTENNRMFGQVMEGTQNKILGVSGNMTDMRINSIYSQDRWYGKESQIFYTDVKDQNPFQVSCTEYEHRVTSCLFLS